MGGLTTTRRGILGAISVAPVAATFGTIPLQAMAATTGWASVRDAYLAADRAVCDDVRSHEPRRKAWVAAGQRSDMRAQFGIDKHLEHNDRLCKASHDALNTVIAYECHSVHELAQKVGIIDEALSDIDDDVWRHVVADARRLAGEVRHG